MTISEQQKRHARRGPAIRATLAAAASLSLLLVPLSAVAEPGAHQRGPRHSPPKCLPIHVQTQLPTYDTNKNGRLDPEEHHAMREAERKADLATYDANNDGRLSKAEHEALRHGKMVQHFEDLDTDRNAEISKAEATGSCTPLEHEFARIDGDGNGSISWSEFEKGATRGPRGARGPQGPGSHHPRPVR